MRNHDARDGQGHTRCRGSGNPGLGGVFPQKMMPTPRVSRINMGVDRTRGHRKPFQWPLYVSWNASHCLLSNWEWAQCAKCGPAPHILPILCPGHRHSSPEPEHHLQGWFSGLPLDRSPLDHFPNSCCEDLHKRGSRLCYSPVSTSLP